MNEIRGQVMDLTGLSAQTLILLQDLLARRIEIIQRRNNGMPEVPELLEIESLSEAYKQVNAAWFNRISWTHRKTLS